MKLEGETYIGDGLYASFDGWQIQLRAPRYEGDHFVYLEPEIYAALVRFANKSFQRTEQDNGPETPEAG